MKKQILLIALVALFIALSVDMFVMADSSDEARDVSVLIQNITDHDIAIVISDPEWISSSGIGLVKTQSINFENRTDIVQIHEDLSIGDTVEVVTADVTPWHHPILAAHKATSNSPEK